MIIKYSECPSVFEILCGLINCIVPIYILIMLIGLCSDIKEMRIKLDKIAQSQLKDK